MRVLELFSGTGSVGNVCRARGMEVVSLDRDMPADIRCDILDWDFSPTSPSPLTSYGPPLLALSTTLQRRRA